MMNTALFDATEELFAQGESLLGTIDAFGYSMKLPAALDASIGSHYRHSLDHFLILFGALETGLVNYDARRRDPEVETDRKIALQRTRELRVMLRALDPRFLDQPLRIRCKVSYAGDTSPESLSTFGRELMFCLIHAIHHYALIRVMAGLLQVALPDSFGVAPSTLHHASRAAA